MMSAKYFEYYTIILRGPFFRGHTFSFDEYFGKTQTGSPQWMRQIQVG